MAFGYHSISSVARGGGIRANAPHDGKKEGKRKKKGKKEKLRKNEEKKEEKGKEKRKTVQI